MIQHPLPRTESCSLDLDARALKAKLEDRERVIAAFRERFKSMEQDLELRDLIIAALKDRIRHALAALDADAKP